VNTTKPRTFAEAEQTLAANLPGYTNRAPQQQMAAFVQDALASEEPCTYLAEAGTGTGKSLAVMIPAILSGQRVVIGTETLALMNQYVKDVEFLQANLGVDFNWALLKGRSNFICRAKVASADASSVPNLAALQAEIAKEGQTGDKDDVAGLVAASDWSKVSSSSDECPGKSECPFGDICFSENAKAKALNARVVITSHAMIAIDTAIAAETEGVVSMMGPYDALILDEAHGFEDVVTNSLSTKFSQATFNRLVNDVSSFARSQKADVLSTFDVSEHVGALFSALPQAKVGDRIRLNLSFFLGNENTVVSLINGLSKMGREIVAIKTTDTRDTARKNMLARRSANLTAKVMSVATDAAEDRVRWVEADVFRGITTVSIGSAPCEVGGFLSEHLWSKRPSILVSATLSVAGSFNYVNGRLGCQGSKTMQVDSPFDYPTQALTFIPKSSVASPKDRGAWMGYAQAATVELVRSAGGGALLLFTSRNALQSAYDAMGPIFQDAGLTVLAQNITGTNKEIAATFRQDEHSVLFGLRSFMTGVDFSGNTCRLVVIDKLPFGVPTDPILQARAEVIKARRGNDFAEMTVPAMTLTLVQAYGRLIRSTSDRGVVAILDSRLSSTGYGQGIVRSLPNAPVTTDLGKVASFFGTEK
jgi:ATP-dependent DNA helicase DinG